MTNITLGVAVVGSAVAIFPRGAAELGHRDDDGVFGEIAQVNPERRKRLRELAQHIRYLALGAAFMDVMAQPPMSANATCTPRFALMSWQVV